MKKSITVNTREHPYKIHIEKGSLNKTGDFLRGRISPHTHIGLMASKTVEKYYRETVQGSLEKAGFPVSFFRMPTGEKNKNLKTVSGLYDALIEKAFDRSCLIITLGGGVVGDTGGFTAATLYRGIPYVQMPTTLLSQVDSSVGGKTGVNHRAGKNLIGSFYQPEAVLIDPGVLHTLDMRERISGFAEILKYGFIRDKGFLDHCLKYRDDILQLQDMDLVGGVIRRSLEIKAEIVAGDEKEMHNRMLLNFGHTVGHALEQSSGYGTFRHGEAVIIGICAALYLSVKSGGLDEKSADHYLNILKKIPIGASLEAVDKDVIHLAIAQDKKTREKRQKFVLLDDIGHAGIVEDLSADLINESIGRTKNIFCKGGM
ncbi:MAG: 3-dehydroquinate synthase [Fidelibacterota bacterium]